MSIFTTAFDIKPTLKAHRLQAPDSNGFILTQEPKTPRSVQQRSDVTTLKENKYLHCPEAGSHSSDLHHSLQKYMQDTTNKIKKMSFGY